jgi:hypothetical protein
MPKLVNNLFFKYQLSCTFPGCGGVLHIEQAPNAGWNKGSTIPYDPGYPDVARCPRCKRHQMRVMNEPPPPPVEEPVGWTKIPTK